MMTARLENGRPQWLVTDLDGTLIPMPDEPTNHADLQVLREELEQHRTSVAYATGRHVASVIRAIDEYDLPVPDWIVCDVGTSILARDTTGELVLVEAYRRELMTEANGWQLHSLRGDLLALDELLTLQEEPKQREFKLSFYVPTERMVIAVARLQHYLTGRDAPFDLISSLDPWLPRGLIDVIPRGASKARAVAWWARQQAVDLECVVYAGDSGNDLAPLIAGCRAIVVGNADAELVDRVQQAHSQQNWSKRLYLADGRATSGVLEGCYWFGLFPDSQRRRP